MQSKSPWRRIALALIPLLALAVPSTAQQAIGSSKSPAAEAAQSPDNAQRITDPVEVSAPTEAEKKQKREEKAKKRAQKQAESAGSEDASPSAPPADTAQPAPEPALASASSSAPSTEKSDKKSADAPDKKAKKTAKKKKKDQNEKTAGPPTALCNDGTFSHVKATSEAGLKTRSGPCKQNGGVSHYY